MGPHPSAPGWIIARALALLSAFALVGACNALLGTPEPELAEEAGADAGGDTATSQAEATTGQDADATTGQDADATTAQDSTAQDSTAQDSTAQDSTAQDSAAPDVAADGTTPEDAEPDATPDEASAEGGAPPSCSDDGGPGVTTCGPTGDSCCNSFLVPGGTYSRVFSTGADGAATSLQSPATVSSFRLDEYEVTVGRFRQFVLATRAGWMPLPGSGKHTHVNGGQGLQQTVAGTAVYESGWVAGWANNMSQPDGGGTGFWDDELASCTVSTWTPQPGSQESLPINCVNWFEAYAFCIWDGGFLPSSAEWEYAAAGGSQEREYPWGATNPGVDSQYAVYGCEYPDGGGTPDAVGTCDTLSNIAPVGTAALGVGRWAQLNLGGNVHEQLFDYYDVDYVTPCTDCAQLSAESSRVSSGGSWLVGKGSLLATYRAYYPGSSVT